MAEIFNRNGTFIENYGFVSLIVIMAALAVFSGIILAPGLERWITTVYASSPTTCLGCYDKN